MLRPALLIFALAVAVRLALLLSPLVPHDWVMSGAHVEVDAVARSLAETGRYADPYVIPTGPTAHPLPVHTGLQALLYLLFGITPAAAWARSVAGIVACGISWSALPWLARRLGLGARTGAIAGAAGGALPFQGIDDILGWLWNESMAAVALAALIAAFVSRWRSPARTSFTRSLALGAGAGVSFHLAPALLPVVLGFAAFEAWWTPSRRRWAGLAALTLGAIVACAPWGLRVHRALGHAFFVRSNFGLELRLSNHDGARADLWRSNVHLMHPGNNLEEARRLRDLGEARYMEWSRDAALAWIAAHAADFARLTGGRAWCVWFGPPARPLQALPVAAVTLLAALGLWRARRLLDMPGLAAIIITLTGYPLVYYLVGYVPRYTFPVAGVLFVLAASNLAVAGARPATAPGLEARHARSG